MTWSTAKTSLEAKLQGNNTNIETEVDGHRVKKRSLEELILLEDYVNTKEDEETNGSTPLRSAGFRIVAKTNTEGLV